MKQFYIFVFKFHRRCRIQITIILYFLNELFSLDFWTPEYDIKMLSFHFIPLPVTHMEICHTELSINVIHNTKPLLKNLLWNQTVILLGKIKQALWLIHTFICIQTAYKSSNLRTDLSVTVTEHLCNKKNTSVWATK